MPKRHAEKSAARSATDPLLRLRALIRRSFPKQSRVISIPRQPEAVYAVSWPLNTDPARPGKRSKIIRLSVASQLIDQYVVANLEERLEVDRQIGDAIHSALDRFDADHAHGIHEEPPVVEWCIEF